MKEITHFCPDCGSYSGDTITVLNKSSTPENEELACKKCGWVGKWIDMTKIIK